MNVDPDAKLKRPVQSTVAAALLCSLALSLPEGHAQPAAASATAAARLACRNANVNQDLITADAAEPVCAPQPVDEDKVHL